jgi:hypothetical protein
MPSRTLLLLALLPLAACASKDSLAGRTQSSATQQSTNAHALQAAPMVRFRVGDGPVSLPVVHPAVSHATLALCFPKQAAGQHADVVIEKLGERGYSEWLRMKPRVTDEASLKIAGLPDGRYRIDAECAGVRYEGEATASKGAACEVELRASRAAAPSR